MSRREFPAWTSGKGVSKGQLMGHGLPTPLHGKRRFSVLYFCYHPLLHPPPHFKVWIRPWSPAPGNIKICVFYYTDPPSSTISFSSFHYPTSNCLSGSVRVAVHGDGIRGFHGLGRGLVTSRFLGSTCWWRDTRWIGKSQLATEAYWHA